MQIPFTKMQGAGNDFIVLDETRIRYPLSAAQYRFMANRHLGVGADQILSVRPAPCADVDFEYVIHNADGGEVEHCGNGARCFVRYVVERGLTNKTTIRVKTMTRNLSLALQADGRVTVDMGAPEFDFPKIPFNPVHARSDSEKNWPKWHLSHINTTQYAPDSMANLINALSMGNPHAIQMVADTDAAPVHSQGAWMQTHPAFPQRVNAGFMQVQSRSAIRLRVFERGAGETLACGTGACAAVVTGIRLGLLDSRVDVHTHGGTLTIEWAGIEHGLQAPVFLTGPATTVFEGHLQVPDNLN